MWSYVFECWKFFLILYYIFFNIIISPEWVDSIISKFDLTIPIGFIGVMTESLMNMHIELLDVINAMSPRLNWVFCFSAPIASLVSIYIIDSENLWILSCRGREFRIVLTHNGERWRISSHGAIPLSNICIIIGILETEPAVWCLSTL